jgi:hypothetical protein
MQRLSPVTTYLTLTLLSLSAILWLPSNIDPNSFAVALPPERNPFNDTETVEKLANVIEGNDTAVILNDTDISSLNNTLLSSIGINIDEDCMRLPNTTVIYCP